MIPPLSRRVASIALVIAASGQAGARQLENWPVSIDVLVMDEAGAPVSGLVAEDFRIVVDGNDRPIVSCTPAQTPLDIILLLDLSASISATLERGVLEDAVEKAVIGALQDGERLRIGGFARNLILSSGLSADRRRLRFDLRIAMSHRRETLYGPSPIWDFTYRAIESFPETQGRRSIVLVTDGRATGNTRSIDDVARAAMLHRVSINIVGQDVSVQVLQGDTSYVKVRPGAGLQWLADVTGGRFISAAELGVRPARPLTTVLESLRQVYTVTFAAPLDGDAKQIQVYVRRPGVKVRARSLYQ